MSKAPEMSLTSILALEEPDRTEGLEKFVRNGRMAFIKCIEDEPVTFSFGESVISIPPEGCLLPHGPAIKALSTDVARLKGKFVEVHEETEAATRKQAREEASKDDKIAEQDAEIERLKAELAEKEKAEKEAAEAKKDGDATPETKDEKPGKGGK